MKIWIWHIIWILIGTKMVSAQDSVDTLPAALILDSLVLVREHFNAPSEVRSQYALSQSALISDDLLFYSSGTVRTNGPGKVTTYTKHGLPSEHTQAYWNDLTLNSPLTGVVDLSTLPNFLLAPSSKITQHNNNIIQFYTPQLRQNQTSIHSALGQYGLFNLGIKHNQYFNRFNLLVGLQHLNSDNNYSYKNDLGQRIEQSNSRYEQNHLILSGSYYLRGHSSIDLHFMTSDIHTQLPPTLFQKSSVAFQDNQSSKLQLSFQSQKDQRSLRIHYGLLSESLVYQDENIALRAKHQFDRHEIGVVWKKINSKNYTFTFNGIQQYEKTNSDNINGRQGLLNTKNYLEIKRYWSHKINSTFSVGAVYGRDKWAPIQYELSSAWLPNPTTKIELNIESIYRLPTYNELFWEPGGNQALLAESGYSLLFDYFQSFPWLSFELGYGHHQIDDRILWTANTSGLFRPRQIGRMGSHEFFVGINKNISSKNIQLIVGGRYTYLVSRLIDHSLPNLAEHVDLPYSPRHNIVHFVSACFKKKLKLKFQGKFLSSSYTTLSNITTLSSFYTSNLKLDYLYQKNSLELEFFIHFKNLNNSTYFLSSGFPQPPRHVVAGLTVHFKQNKNE